MSLIHRLVHKTSAKKINSMQVYTKSVILYVSNLQNKHTKNT